MVTQLIQNICITFVQRCPNVSDVGPALYKCCLQMFCVCRVGTSRRHHGNLLVYVDTSKEFSFSLEKCSMLMVEPSACDVSEQSYGNLKFGRIYSLNYLQNNSQNYGI